MSSNVKHVDESMLFKEVKIPAYQLLRKSLNLISIPIEGKTSNILLSPLMVCDSIYIKNSKYMSDKTAMLYKHMLEDPTLDIDYIEKQPNTNSYDEITYKSRYLSLKLTTGFKLTVKISNKVYKYANKVLKANTSNSVYLISAMYIYTNLLKSYSYPAMIISKNSMPITARDGRIMSVKKNDTNIRAILTPAQEIKYKRIQEAGTAMIRTSRAISMTYEVTINIMSMLYYLVGCFKDDYHSMYTNKYIDFIIREMIDKPVETITFKRDLIRYIVMYRSFVRSNEVI